jgi:serine phosphatase RsbU (regulator of sigma subunit)/tetratricopeptide (TPR) repeat protein
MCFGVNAQINTRVSKLLSVKEVKQPELYVLVADTLNTLKQNTDAIALLQKVAMHPQIKQISKLQAQWHLVMADCFDDMQEYRKSVHHYIISSNLVEQFKDDKLSIRSYVGLAGAYSDLGENDSALYFLNKALPIAKAHTKQHFRYLKTIYNNFGLIYIEKYNYTEALNSFYKAIAVSEKENDIDGMSSTYNNMGNLYSQLTEYKKSLSYYFKAHQIKPTAVTYGNIGMVYGDIDRYDSALYYTKKSIEIDTKNNDKAGLSSSYTVVGNLFKKGLLYDSALYYYNLSSKIAAEVEDIEVIQNNNYNTVEIYILQKRYQEAKPIALKNLKSVMQSDDLEFIADSYNQLKVIYSNLGDFQTAFKYLEQNSIYKDSALEADKSIDLKKIELAAEYKKKSSNDSLLHVQQTELTNLKHDGEIKKQRVLLLSFIVILIIVAFFSIIIFKRYKVSIRQKEIINLQKNEMFHQKLLVEEKQKEILDSINYAKRIQQTLLAHEDFLKQHLPNHFIYYNPKDIVSGDFYWATVKANKFYFALCDSTGHGVPGAFMSLLNIGFLSEAINEKNILQPNQVFNYVRQRLIDNLNKDGQKDGFDGVLLCYDSQTMELQYAAANNKPVLLRDNELTMLSDDRMPVGKGEKVQDFNLYTLQLKKGDSIYLYTDGYADQFGGERGKKFKYRLLNELIFKNHTKSLNEQQDMLSSNFNNWKGELEQVDDVCVVGIKL